MGDFSFRKHILFVRDIINIWYHERIKFVNNILLGTLKTFILATRHLIPYKSELSNFIQ